jgi:DNA-binding transcriptional MerR regulator
MIEIEPTYTIEETANLLAVQPETIRLWEDHGLLSPPGRRHARRSYNSRDLKKLLFIQEFLRKGLSITYLLDYLSLYPCWTRDDCSKYMGVHTRADCSRPCWKEKGTYCQVPLGHQDLCKTCEFKKSIPKKVIPLARRAVRQR